MYDKKYTKEGKINRSVGILQDNDDLIRENKIDNFSAFINELINEALCDKDHKKRILVKRLNDMQLDFEKIGIKLECNLTKLEIENEEELDRALDTAAETGNE